MTAIRTTPLLFKICLRLPRQDMRRPIWMIRLNIVLSLETTKICTTPLFFKICLCSATSIESSRRDLLNDMAERKVVLSWKISKNAPRFIFLPKTRKNSLKEVFSLQRRLFWRDVYGVQPARTSQALPASGRSYAFCWSASTDSVHRESRRAAPRPAPRRRASGKWKWVIPMRGQWPLQMHRPGEPREAPRKLLGLVLSAPVILGGLGRIF